MLSIYPQDGVIYPYLRWWFQTWFPSLEKNSDTKKKNQFTLLDGNMRLVLKISSEMAEFRVRLIISACFLGVHHDKETTALNVFSIIF